MQKSFIRSCRALCVGMGLLAIVATPAVTAQTTPAGLKRIEAGVTIAPEDATAIWAVLDKFMTTFRMPLADHIDRHLETFLFPHVRVASQKIFVSPDAKTYRDEVLQLKAMPEGWDHSEWAMRRIAQAGKDKAHVIVTFNRYRKDHSQISSEDSLYIMEKVNGQWGIRGRSSFAR